MWVPTLHPVETVLRATVVFIGVQVLFRVVGRKELSRSSLWDLVALFLVGTALRNTLVCDDNSLTTGLLALTTLLAWDRLVSRLVYHSQKVERFLQGPVVELVRDGEIVEAGLRRTLITRDHLESQLRRKGYERLTQVRRAFMEADGNIAFLMKQS